MKEPLARLRDGEAVPGSVEAEGIALLRARERYTPPAARKARVRAAFEARGGASWIWRWRPVVFAAILLVGAVGSSASFGGQWIGAGYHRLLAWIVPMPTPIRQPAVVPPPVPGGGTMRAAMVDDAPATAPAVEAVPARETRPARPTHRPVAVRTEPSKIAPTGLKDDPKDEPKDEPTMVATAMRALRRDHDPAHAARLLDDYLARWPDGALVEEALALAIEAARARGDTRAPALAADYLRRFPRGRFADAARRTLAEPVAP